MPTLETLTAQEIAQATGDKSVFIGHNILWDSSDVHWSSLGGSFAAASAGHVGEPSNTYDRMSSPDTGPDGVGTPGIWDLAWELPVNTYRPDSCAILGSNLHRLWGTVGDYDIRLQCSDTNDFAVIHQVAAWSITADGEDRFGKLWTQGVRGCRWWRLRFIRISGAWPSGPGVCPKVREVYIGKRRQMSFGFERPYNKDNTRTKSEIEEYPGGQFVGVLETEKQGFWEVAAKLRTDSTGADNRTIWRSFLNDSDGGGPHIFIPEANDPDRLHFAQFAERGNVINDTSHAFSEMAFRSLELPPFYATRHRTGLGE